jgi:glycosyltransferase involved in cell wall biosynthesis
MGIRTSMYARTVLKGGEHIKEFSLPTDLISRVRRWARRLRIRWDYESYEDSRPSGLELFSDDRTGYGPQVPAHLPDCDLVNLHWIANFVSLSAFFRAVEVPVVWTLHDMNAFTGGCHYNVGCRKFEQQCGACPQLGSTDENDLSRSVWTRKWKAYESASRSNRIHIVAPSQWLAQEAQRSTLFAEAPVHVIPYGLNTDLFQPRDTERLRSALEIPREHRIVLFVAQSAQKHRKGFDLLADAVSSLSAGAMTLLSIGGNEPDLGTALPHTHLGTIESDLLLSVFYSLADLFVIPSRQDNLPNTVLESMACGTPVVGFDTGGIPDMVRPGETGWLAETRNVRALRDAIEQALADGAAREQRGQRGRGVVEKEYTLERQARRYRDLYRRILRESGNPAG